MRTNTTLRTSNPKMRGKKVRKSKVKLELELPADTTTTATWDPRHVCDLHHSSQQHWIPDPLSKAGIEATSSRILVRYNVAAPQQELPQTLVFIMRLSLYDYQAKASEYRKGLTDLKNRATTIYIKENTMNNYMPTNLTPRRNGQLSRDLQSTKSESRRNISTEQTNH